MLTRRRRGIIANGQSHHRLLLLRSQLIRILGIRFPLHRKIPSPFTVKFTPLSCQRQYSQIHTYIHTYIAFNSDSMAHGHRHKDIKKTYKPNYNKRKYTQIQQKYRNRRYKMLSYRRETALQGAL